MKAKYSSGIIIKKEGVWKIKENKTNQIYNFNKNKDFINKNDVWHLRKGAKVSFKLDNSNPQVKEIKILDKYYVPLYLLKNIENPYKTLQNLENFYLKLNKFVFGEYEKDELKFKIEKIPNITTFPYTREIQCFINEYETTLLTKIYSIYKIVFKNFSLNSKLIIGLGSPSIYEVSMTLHHIYGFPYIPAQAMKGVLRNYFINEYFDLSEKRKNEIEDVKKIAKAKEDLAEENPIFKFIFGSQDSEGNIIFFDTFPVGDIKLQIDIMNNHFPDYYEKDEPPADWQNPKPIKFLVVKNTPFKVFIGIKRNVSLEKLKEKLNEFKEKNENHKKFIEDFENKLDSQENLLNHLLNHLEKAFEWYGIGAKTSVGYGLMSEKIDFYRL